MMTEYLIIFVSLGLLSVFAARLIFAKKHAPLAALEAEALWQIHKRQNDCGSRTWKEIVHKNALVGFECECGLEYIQMRPVA